jgi:hypothetical protein
MTRAAAVLDFIGGVVCNPRKKALLRACNKGDAIDARKRAELLRAGLLSPVYHGESSALEIQHLTRSYLMLTEDTTRVMGRLKAVFAARRLAVRGRSYMGASTAVSIWRHSALAL